MQIYMHLTDLTRALYMAVCKDTDALHIERVRADRAAAGRLLDKAWWVIKAKRPPSRISEDPAWWECQFCEHRTVCHEGAAAENNCRTCLHSTPVEGGWHCARFDQGIESADSAQRLRQASLHPRPGAGQGGYAGDDHIVYCMADGTEWVNDAREGGPC